MSLPSVMFLADTYHAAFKMLAWQGAGWLAVERDGRIETYGPPSISRTVDLDVLDMTGCIDARLTDPEAP